jgi:hypothetical protein
MTEGFEDSRARGSEGDTRVALSGIGLIAYAYNK